MEVEYEKVSMVDQIAIAVTSPKSYKALTGLKVGKTVAFVILLTFMLTFIQTGIGIVCFLLKIGGFENLFMNKIPDFVYEDGTLTMDTEMEFAVGNVTVFVNTDYDKIAIEEMENDGVYITLGKTRMVMGAISAGYTYEQGEFLLSKMLPENLNNETLCSFIPAIYFTMALMYIGGMLGNAIKWLFFALIFSVMARALASNFQTGLDYKDVFRICIYGQTLGLLLSAANASLGYFLPSTFMFFIMLIISFVFINRGILSHIKFPGAPPGSM